MVFGHLPSTIEQEADFVGVYDNLGRDLDIQQQNLSFLIIDTSNNLRNESCMEYQRGISCLYISFG